MAVFVALAVATLAVIFWRATLTLVVIVLVGLLLLGLNSLRTQESPLPRSNPSHDMCMIHAVR